MIRIAVVLILVAAAVVAGIILWPHPTPEEPPPGEAPRSAPEPATLTLFFSGEEKGYLEPCGCDDTIIGGFPRRFSVMETVIREDRATLALENGDLNGDIGEQPKLKHRYQVQTLQAIGCQALNIGERDLMLGVDHLKEVRDLAGFPFLTTNIFQAPDVPLFETIAHIPLRVGQEDRQAVVLGVLADSLGPYAEQQGLLTLEARRAVDAALEGVTADLRILLFHGDLDEARVHFGDHPKLDLVIAGHDRDKPEALPAAGGPPFFTTGEKGKVLCRLDVTFGGKRPEIGPFRPVSLTNVIPDSPRIVPILRQYYEEVAQNDFFDELKIEYPPGGQQFVGSKACRGACHEHDAAFKIWEASAHAHALDTLKEDGKGRDKDPECVVCHVVGLGFESGFSGEDATPHLASVGCESCHGVGSGHAENPEKGYGHARGEKSCLPCHTPENSPNFDFETYWKKIAH